jgi:glycolate oxidase FAD binding subunit
MSIAGTAVSTRLSEIAGATNVVADPEQRAAYRIDGQTPAAAVRPGSAEEISEIVKFAAAEKLAVVPTGARTKLAMGMPLRKYDLALDMTRLDHLAAYDPADLTLGVEPGMPLQRLAGVLAGHRQFLPLAVPFLSRATVGGTIASGIDSPLRQFYGTARDFVLGMEFVTGEGVQAKSGGRVVKNVSGYDLHKLLIGSAGTLGVITRINFRTFPVPASTRGFAAICDSADQACDLRQRVAQSPLRPLTVDILSPDAVELLSSEVAARIEPGTMPFDRAAKNQWTFTTSFAGHEKTLDRCARELHQMADKSGAASVVLLGEDRIPGAFGRQREFIPIALESSQAMTVVKLGVLPARMKEILAAVAKSAEASELPWAALARGVGVIYVALLPRAQDEDSRQHVARVTEEIIAACTRVGGNSAILCCPAEWKQSLKVCGLERGDFPLMHKLKNVFDPQGILSPGRCVGGM